jgi:serine/threonine-protein kinase
VPPARVPAGQPGAANHTLIVSPGNLVTDSRQDLGRYRGRRDRDYRRSGEPLLQRLLFSRKVIYLGGGLAAILAIVLVAWWLTSGQYATVPRVYGMSASVARTELTNLGFVVKTGAGQHSNLPKGEVLLTKPAIGTKASQGSTVLLVASIGPVQIPVPQVTGMPLAQAQAALRKAGLTPGKVTTEPSQTIPVGIVISTTPVVGTSWPKPKPVGLTVSAGLPLPNFVGQQLAAAQAAASSGGYAVNPVNDPKSQDPAGTITSQSPAANTPISPSEVVTVHVSMGPQQVNIPDVTGLSVDHAQKVLEEAGFQVTVNQVTQGHHVISYSPVGQAPQGSTITLTVGFILTLP